MIALLVLLSCFAALFAGWRFFFFFRNPTRNVVQDASLVVAPADGFVLYARRVTSEEELFSVKRGRVIRLSDLLRVDAASLPRRGLLIGIYMSPFDVHYNRAPIRGHLAKLSHDFPDADRRNLTMFDAQANLLFDQKPYTQDCDYLVTNERAGYLLRGERVSVYLTQIADRWVKRIVTLREGVEVEQGEVFGLIRMGSQVDLFLPDPSDAHELLVREREHVKAGLTPLVRLTGLDGEGGRQP